MSIRLMTAAWSIDMPSTDKLVLLALADWANDAGHCWPSMTQLAAKSGLTDRAVQKAIQRLASAGHLTRQEVTGKGVNYYIHPGTTFTPERRSPPNEKTKTPERRSPNTPVTVIDTPNGVSKGRDKPQPMPAWVPREAWDGFVEMRRKARKPMTPRAQALLLKKLAQLRDEGHDPGAVLDQSTMNNWQGIFPIKDASNGNGHMGRNGSAATRPSASLDWIERNLGGGRGAAETDAWAQGVHRGTGLALPGGS